MSVCLQPIQIYTVAPIAVKIDMEVATSLGQRNVILWTSYSNNEESSGRKTLSPPLGAPWCGVLIEKLFRRKMMSVSKETNMVIRHDLDTCPLPSQFGITKDENINGVWQHGKILCLLNSHDRRSWGTMGQLNNVKNSPSSERKRSQGTNRLSYFIMPYLSLDTNEIVKVATVCVIYFITGHKRPPTRLTRRWGARSAPIRLV